MHRTAGLCKALDVIFNSATSDVATSNVSDLPRSPSRSTCADQDLTSSPQSSARGAQIAQALQVDDGTEGSLEGEEQQQTSPAPGSDHDVYENDLLECARLCLLAQEAAQVDPISQPFMLPVPGPEACLGLVLDARNVVKKVVARCHPLVHEGDKLEAVNGLPVGTDVPWAMIPQISDSEGVVILTIARGNELLEIPAQCTPPTVVKESSKLKQLLLTLASRGHAGSELASTLNECVQTFNAIDSAQQELLRTLAGRSRNNQAQISVIVLQILARLEKVQKEVEAQREEKRQKEQRIASLLIEREHMCAREHAATAREEGSDRIQLEEHKAELGVQREQHERQIAALRETLSARERELKELREELESRKMQETRPAVLLSTRGPGPRRYLNPGSAVTPATHSPGPVSPQSSELEPSSVSAVAVAASAFSGSPAERRGCENIEREDGANEIARSAALEAANSNVETSCIMENCYEENDMAVRNPDQEEPVTYGGEGGGAGAGIILSAAFPYVIEGKSSDSRWGPDSPE